MRNDVGAGTPTTEERLTERGGLGHASNEARGHCAGLPPTAGARTWYLVIACMRPTRGAAADWRAGSAGCGVVVGASALCRCITFSRDPSRVGAVASAGGQQAITEG